MLQMINLRISDDYLIKVFCFIKIENQISYYFLFAALFYSQIDGCKYKMEPFPKFG